MSAVMEPDMTCPKRIVTVLEPDRVSLLQSSGLLYPFFTPGKWPHDVHFACRLRISCAMMVCLWAARQP